jgi:RND family efflux transporter MFP subunit
MIAAPRHLAGLLAAGLLLPAVVLGQPGLPVPEAVVVVAPVVEQALRDEIQFIGTVEPDRWVTVQAEVSGRVVRAEIREGQPVIEGKTELAVLDPVPAELRLGEARAAAAKARQEWEKQRRGFRREEIEAAREAVARAEATLRDLLAGARPQELEQARSGVVEAEARRVLAEREFRRAEELLAQGLVAAQERDRAWQVYEVAKAGERAARERRDLMSEGTRPDQIAAARAEVRQARERLKLLEAGPRPEEVAQAEAEHRQAMFVVERLEDELRRMRIIAPLTGFLVRKRAEVGAWLRPGDPVADLIDLDPVYVVGPLGERDVPRLAPGARARVRLDAYPERVFDGEIAHIVPQADPQSRAFPVKIRIANPDFALKAGMLARVAIAAGTGKRALFLPKDAVVRRDAGTVVFVVDGDVARARAVRTGRAAGDLVEIVEGALSAGQEVVVVGNESLQDGAPLRKVSR